MCGRSALVCLALMTVTVAAQRFDLYEGDYCKRVAGVDWTCKKLNDCAKAQEDLKNGKRPENCGFSERGEVIVCCQPSQTTSRPRPPTQRPTQRPTQKPTQRPIQRPTQRPTYRPISRPPTTGTKRPKPTQSNRIPIQGGGIKSKQMCKKYAESVYLTYTDIYGVEQKQDLCPVGLVPLITNGTKADPREFPHMALIGYGNKNKIQWKCGGSLISERWVLSAAHCTLTGDDRPKWVRLGEYDVRSTKDEEERLSQTEDFDIVERINHPEYDAEKEYNDIALYRLNRDVVFNEYVRPICLHTDYQIPKSQGLITGWGRIASNRRGSDVLLKGNVTFIPGKKCRDDYNTIENLDREIRDTSMVCAANFASGTDTCQGDSGGPLQYLLSDPYCMYSQVGITSFGIKCASNFPGVYTRVSHFVPWIESIVWR